MKSLITYFLESREDGKYLDLPKSINKPFMYPGISKTEKENAKKIWKEYQDSVIKINAENFDILIDKLKKGIESKQGHNNFILNAQTCKFDNFYGKDENGDKDFFDDVEHAAKKARIALETDDINAATFIKTRQKKTNSYDKDQTLFWWNSKGYTFSIYQALCVITQAYNIDIPKFNEKFNIWKTDSIDSKYDYMWNSTSHSRNDAAREKQSHRTWDKAEKEYEKDSVKIKKAREAFKKSGLFKEINAILDKDEEAKKVADAIEKVKDAVQDALDKSFGSHARISWGIDNLYKLAAKAYLESDEKQPEIKELSNHTGGWLSGMHTTCEFEIIGANGTSYGKIKLQDKGLDGDDGKPVDGFGAYD